MKRFLPFAALGFVALLSGCGGVNEALGFGRNAPDEFAVVDRPPLALPPDFELRPPRPGAPRPQEVNMKQRASTMLFGATSKDANVVEKGDAAEGKEGTSTAKSETEKALLESAGAAKAEPEIRALIDRESAEHVVGTEHLVDELLWWKERPQAPATTVDAPAEAERLKEAKEKGEPVNAGATPTIERRKSGWLGL
ncbi:MAG: DUF3035 domain-containing protein [Alphaproteobacteria bacterium]|nr:DUF3035 domain-containing protein [Alphaproteobacteria bacterium]